MVKCGGFVVLDWIRFWNWDIGYVIGNDYCVVWLFCFDWNFGVGIGVIGGGKV